MGAAIEQCRVVGRWPGQERTARAGGRVIGQNTPRAFSGARQGVGRALPLAALFGGATRLETALRSTLRDAQGKPLEVVEAVPRLPPCGHRFAPVARATS